MSNTAPLGRYLDRDVLVCSSSELYSRLKPSCLGHAVVLIWLSTEQELSAFRQHLDDLTRAAPLVLSVAGAHAEKAFAELLRHLDRVADSPHIMTKSNEGEPPNCIAELFQATWPSENRFEDWEAYIIVTSAAEMGSLEVIVAELLS